jgi:spore coat protein A
VTWVNDLGTTAQTQVLAYKLSVDQTVHWADPNGLACPQEGGIPAVGSACASNYEGPIPAVVHLHGGEVPPELDGGPDAWFLSQPAAGYQMYGHAYYSKGGAEGNQAVYASPNAQEATPLWFHDHTLGATTLNVYAGLAGGYLIIDPDLPLPQGLTTTGLVGPDDRDVPLIPLIIQDRFFDTDGQLFYTTNSNGGQQWAPNPEHPYWTPEIFADTNVVNGKVWPYLAVEPKRYRFLFLDGANSRAYSMSLVDESSGNPGPPIWIIGNDEGYIEAPVEIDPAAGQELLMMPGERYDVIIDFSGLAAGTNLMLKNTANAPFPDGDPVDAATSGRIMQFRVGSCTSGACGDDDPSYNPASGGSLVPEIVRFTDPATGQLAPGATVQVTRMLTLNEILLPATTATNPATGAENTMYPGGSLALLMNNTMWNGDSSRTYDDFLPVTLNGVTTYYSELPQEGDAELWEIVNLTEDAHPIHTHLTDMQILNRQDVDIDGYMRTYSAAFPATTLNGVDYPGGTYVPGFGPPLDYQTGNSNALGGNPEVTPFLRGAVRPPGAYESGWKDTIVAYPGQVTRVIVRFAPSTLPVDAPPALLAYPFNPGGTHGYVWHCHITTHEDNEMMRPYQVQLNPLALPPDERPLQLGRDY